MRTANSLYIAVILNGNNHHAQWLKKHTIKTCDCHDETLIVKVSISDTFKHHYICGINKEKERYIGNTIVVTAGYMISKEETAIYLQQP